MPKENPISNYLNKPIKSKSTTEIIITQEKLPSHIHLNKALCTNLAIITCFLEPKKTLGGTQHIYHGQNLAFPNQDELTKQYNTLFGKTWYSDLNIIKIPRYNKGEPWQAEELLFHLELEQNTLLHCQLKGIRFGHEVPTGTFLWKESNLTGSAFDNSYFHSGLCLKSNLEKTSFVGITGFGYGIFNFEECNLKEANFFGTRIEFGFNRCNLNSSNFSNYAPLPILHGIPRYALSFKRVSAVDAIFDGATIENSRSGCVDSDLTGSRFYFSGNGLPFSCKNLTFSKCILDNTYLSGKWHNPNFVNGTRANKAFLFQLEGISFKTLATIKFDVIYVDKITLYYMANKNETLANMLKITTENELCLMQPDRVLEREDVFEITFNADKKTFTIANHAPKHFIEARDNINFRKIPYIYNLLYSDIKNNNLFFTTAPKQKYEETLTIDTFTLEICFFGKPEITISPQEVNQSACKALRLGDTKFHFK